MRLPILTYWLALRSKSRAPVLNASEEFLLVRAEPGFIRVDIRNRLLRSSLGRSIVAKRIEGPLAITNSFERRLIGRLPLIGNPPAIFATCGGLGYRLN